MRLTQIVVYRVKRDSLGGSRGMRTSDTALYFHVGLPKTATTLLQTEVFPRLKGLVHVNTNIDYGLFARQDRAQAFLVSNENIFSGPFVTTSGSWLEDFRIGIRNLSAVAPDAGVIIGFREHASLLRSLYGQHLRDGGARPFDASFYDLDTDGGLLKTSDLLFGERIRTIRGSFDREPFVYFQEELRLAPRRLVADLADYMGVVPMDSRSLQMGVVNPGLKHYQATLLRMLNEVSRVLPLKNVLARKLHVTPYDICQRHLGWVPSPAIRFGAIEASRVQSQYDEDLQTTLDFVSRTRGTRVADELLLHFR